MLPCRIWSFCIKRCGHKYMQENPRNWERWNSALLGWEAWLTPNHTPLPHVKFGSSATKGVRINRKEPQKLGIAGTPPPSSGAMIPKSSPLPTCVTTSNLVVLRQRVCTNRREPHRIAEGWGTAPPPCGRGVADPLKIRRLPHVFYCRIWSF